MQNQQAAATPSRPLDCQFTFACDELQGSFSWVVASEGKAQYVHPQSTSSWGLPPSEGWLSAQGGDTTPLRVQCSWTSPLKLGARMVTRMPEGSLLREMSQTPISFVIIAVNGAVFWFLKAKGYTPEEVGCSYAQVTHSRGVERPGAREREGVGRPGCTRR